METLASIQARVNELLADLHPRTSSLPTYGRTEDGARPHLEVQKDGRMDFVVVERGRELRRDTTYDIDELLYWIFDGVTFTMACDWELAHRIEGQDCRKLIFTKQFELLADLDPHWTERCRAELGHRVADAGL
jgi:hypothetical protein